MKKTYFISLLFLLISLNSISQNIDSLKEELQSSTQKEDVLIAELKS